jgi:hypothetical protein
LCKPYGEDLFTNDPWWCRTFPGLLNVNHLEVCAYHRFSAQIELRKASFMERSSRPKPSLPTLETLPQTDASLYQIIRFARSAEPTEYFHDLWGEQYRTKVQALWDRCLQSFKAGTAVEGEPEELLMCLAYDIALGPYLGVPDPHKLFFLRWLIAGMRERLRRTTQADR